MESKIVALTLVCALIILMCTQYGQRKYLKLGDSFDVKSCGDKL